jgi:hypothetical protein
MDMRLTGIDPDGNRAGTIHYSIYDNVPRISLVSVPERRRLGVATALLHVLQDEHPGIEIEWGYQTEDGSALYGSILFDDITDPQRKADAERLSVLQERTEKLVEEMTSKVGERNTPAEHEEFLRRVAEMNDWYDEIRELEAALDNIPERIRLMRTGSSPSSTNTEAHETPKGP